MNFLKNPIYRTSERKLIVQDIKNQFSKVFWVSYSFDSNEIFGNEYDLWFSTSNFRVTRKIYSGFDEDVYDYLKNMLTGSNSFAILRELKLKGVI
jgi:hypothetical protein